jgi:hypothetical protein
LKQALSAPHWRKISFDALNVLIAGEPRINAGRLRPDSQRSLEMQGAAEAA